MDTDQTPQQNQKKQFQSPATVSAVKKLLAGDIVAPKGDPKKGFLGKAGYLLGGTISKDSILLGVIVILLLVIIAMATFVIGAAANSGVQVTFKDPESSPIGSTDSTPTNSTSEPETSNTDPTIEPNLTTNQVTTTDITIMMLASNIINEGKTFPEGSRTLEIGDNNSEVSLVPTVIKIDVAEGQELKTSLELLFGQRSVIYRGISLTTQLHLSDITVNIIIDNTGSQIQLTGDLVAEGTISPFYIKSQIEGTIEQITSDYVITLNGTTTEYECFGDESGFCGN